LAGSGTEALKLGSRPLRNTETHHGASDWVRRMRVRVRAGAVPDIMAWATKPTDESPSGLAEVGRRVGKLGHISWVDVRTEGSMMHVSCEEGGDEQEEIKHALREVGYEVLKVSHRGV
jgi:hypothetical protein